MRAQFNKKANLATIMELKRRHNAFFDVNDGVDEIRVVYPREKTEEVLPVVQRMLNLKAQEGGAPRRAKVRGVIQENVLFQSRCLRGVSRHDCSLF